MDLKKYCRKIIVTDMNLRFLLYIGVAAAVLLTSCEMRDELRGEYGERIENGKIELGVEMKKPVSQSRSTETSEFPVLIKGINEDNLDVVLEYESVAQVPSAITVPVGDYVISSHTPGNLEKEMDAPYYMGDKQITVVKGVTTTADVICSMANSRIQIKYGEDFINGFESWTIMVDDGTEVAIPYTQNDLNPQPVYWYFSDNVEAITVNIQATTKDGNSITDRRVFRKSDASEHYENVGNAFTGGDAIDIVMGAIEAAGGEVTGITVSASITFEDYEEAVELPSYDEDGNDGGETPLPSEKVTLNLPDDVTYSISAGNAPAAADAYIASDAGLDKIVVTIVAGNDAFQAILVDLTMDGQSFLAENGGVDLIDNSDFGNLVATVGSQAPTDGCKEYTFPIGAFFTFLDMTGATDDGKSHEFHITVTDKNGEQATGVFKVTINE